MIKKIKKFKKIRIHREGTDTLLYSFIAYAALALLLFRLDNKLFFWSFLIIFGAVYTIVLNFYRCPVRCFSETDETEKVVVAPADGKIVVIEEVDENEYFHDRRLMISIFMSLFNVHAHWFPVDGKVKFAGAMARRIVTYAKEGEDYYIDEHLGFIKLGSRVDVFLPIGTEVCVKMGQTTIGDQTIIAKLK